jgi:endonuclease-3
MYRWNLTNGKNVVQTEKDAKRIFPRKFGMTYTSNYWYGREYSGSWLGFRKILLLKRLAEKLVILKNN